MSGRRKCRFVTHEGYLSYQFALGNQMSAVERIIKDDSAPYEVHFLEHQHVVTLGRAVEAGHLLYSKDRMIAEGFEWVEVSRGGSITYHGPGQLVVYLHLNLKELDLSLTRYLRDLEQWVIDAMSVLGVDAGRVAGKTGVWVPEGKICAMGVAAKRYTSYHGLGFNFDVDLDRFKWFIPCGLSEPVASLSPILKRKVEKTEVITAMKTTMPPWLSELPLQE